MWSVVVVFVFSSQARIWGKGLKNQFLPALCIFKWWLAALLEKNRVCGCVWMFVGGVQVVGLYKDVILILNFHVVFHNKITVEHFSFKWMSMKNSLRICSLSLLILYKNFNRVWANFKKISIYIMAENIIFKVELVNLQTEWSYYSSRT